MTVPRLVLSRCLELDPCRYNGASISAPIVRLLEAHVELVPVCPEVEIGLGVPRDPIRLVQLEGALRLVQPGTGVDLTDEMTSFGEHFLDDLEAVDGFVLKARSPSCGIGDAKVYSQVDGGPSSGKESGLFAASVRARHPLLPVEHEGRLTDWGIRDHFLIRLFAFARLRELEQAAGMADLVRFHARHKLVLLAHGQATLRRLGRLVANQERLPLPELMEMYALGFRQALRRPARRGSHVNVLQHAQGYFKKALSAREKRHFDRLLQDYVKGRLSRAAPLALVQSWIARFGEEYLEEQIYFDPYPAEFLELQDTGKGQRS
jgi:uncharacterized protein YbgA (DUF1722 family)/uncharacterized protein YbbK (DUF523 family)